VTALRLPTRIGIRFTEQMKGFVALGDLDPESGQQQGKATGDQLMFELTISVDDVDRFVSDPGHQGSAAGYVESDLLGGRLEVERGWFNLFVEIDDPSRGRCSTGCGCAGRAATR
jgi:cholesterol oxidase